MATGSGATGVEERIVGTTALILAITATGLAVAAWIRELAPVLGSVQLG